MTLRTISCASSQAGSQLPGRGDRRFHAVARRRVRRSLAKTHSGPGRAVKSRDPQLAMPLRKRTDRARATAERLPRQPLGRRLTDVLVAESQSARLDSVLERAILRLDTGDEVPVEIVREHADRDEIVIRRTRAARKATPTRNLVAAVDAHLASATPHPAGSTDRALEADRG